MRRIKFKKHFQIKNNEDFDSKFKEMLKNSQIYEQRVCFNIFSIKTLDN